MKKSIMKKLFVMFLVVGIANICNATLVLYYNFNETAGTTAADTAGVGSPAYDGTLRDGLTFDSGSVSGKYGGALNMNGDVDIAMNSDDSGNLPGALAAGNNFTISLWFKNANWTDGGVIFAYGKSDLRFTIGFSNLNGVPEIRVYSKALNGANPDVLIREQLPLPGIDNDVWHHLAVVVSSTLGDTAADPLIYVDGSSSGGTATTNAWVTDLGVRLGRRESTTKVYYDGYIDDFAIFDMTLTSQEISAIYNSTTAIPEPATMTLLALGLTAVCSRTKK
ncbi:MAG: hypothetical protein A2Y12_20650 [Planctomycetes bacterium GWF2_42_9]|nr:MAG: hypothetical protein A2Y12_20650 [Planctomycetes bacterium GWF2_42_9]